MMSDDKKLYPLEFCSVSDTFDWGTEEFLLTDLGYRDSSVKNGWLATNGMNELMETFLDRIVGENAFDYYGLQFPFQVKRLKVNGKMPICVCPDDEIAETRYDALGKEKIWYVESAEEGASLLLGFARDTDASEVFQLAGKGGLEEITNTVPARKGEIFCIPAGIPHSASGKLSLLEISECSATDLALDGESLFEAIDLIDYTKHTPGAKPQITQVRLVNPGKIEKVETEAMDTCVCYVCLEGKASIRCRLDGAVPMDFKVRKGGCILVPAEISEYSVIPEESGTLILEAIPAKRTEKDRYINPDAEEKLEEEV